MKRYLYIGLALYLFGGGIYLLSQCFPTLFGLTNPLQQENNAYNSSLLTDSLGIKEYVLALCGNECEYCTHSSKQCASLIEEQINMSCDIKNQQTTICFYDISKLIAACNELCS